MIFVYLPHWSNAFYYLSTHHLTADEPGFYRYGSNTCTGQRLGGHSSLYHGCLFKRDDSTDDYVPTFLAPPVPSVSTTPFPTSMFGADYMSTDNVFCTAKSPTSIPASVPTTYPTSSAVRSVQFDVVQVSGVFGALCIVENGLDERCLLPSLLNFVVNRELYTMHCFVSTIVSILHLSTQRFSLV